MFPRAHPPTPQIHEWGAVQFTGLSLCSEFPALSKQLRLWAPSTERGQLSEPRETKTWVLLAWGTDTPTRLVISPTCPSCGARATPSWPLPSIRWGSSHVGPSEPGGEMTQKHLE